MYFRVVIVSVYLCHRVFKQLFWVEQQKRRHFSEDNSASKWHNFKWFPKSQLFFLKWNTFPHSLVKGKLPFKTNSPSISGSTTHTVLTCGNMMDPHRQILQPYHQDSTSKPGCRQTECQPFCIAPLPYSLFPPTFFFFFKVWETNSGHT